MKGGKDVGRNECIVKGDIGLVLVVREATMQIGGEAFKPVDFGHWR